MSNEAAPNTTEAASPTRYTTIERGPGGHTYSDPSPEWPTGEGGLRLQGLYAHLLHSQHRCG